jgi:hypothetical protein
MPGWSRGGMEAATITGVRMLPWLVMSRGAKMKIIPCFLYFSIISNSPLSCVGVCSRYTASFVLDLDDIIAGVEGNCSS